MSVPVRKNRGNEPQEAEFVSNIATSESEEENQSLKNKENQRPTRNIFSFLSLRTSHHTCFLMGIKLLIFCMIRFDFLSKNFCLLSIISMLKI